MTGPLVVNERQDFHTENSGLLEERWVNQPLHHNKSKVLIVEVYKPQSIPPWNTAR